MVWDLHLCTGARINIMKGSGHLGLGDFRGDEVCVAHFHSEDQVWVFNTVFLPTLTSHCPSEAIVGDVAEVLSLQTLEFV